MEISEPAVEPAFAKQTEILLQLDADKAAAPITSTPEEVAAETPPAEETITAPVASETEKITATKAVTAEAIPDAPPPAEPAEPVAEVMEPAAPTPTSSLEPAAGDKPAVA